VKNIENIKTKYTELFAKEYYSKESLVNLTENELMVCSSLGEFWAYVYSVIPEEYGHFTIFDFLGYTIDKTTNERQVVIHPRIALQAKNQICQYCWSMDWKTIKDKKDELKNDDQEIMKFLRNHSVMDRRSKRGDNVIIYGVSEQPIGRTMVASIIMKEAIKLRITHHARKHTYDWIDFNTLLDAVEKDSLDLADYRSCDWLVVDNIISKYRSAKQTTLFIDLVDPFFIGRFNDRLPTILVFKFDVKNPAMMIEKRFGVGINRIIDSNRTYKVPLSCGDTGVTNG
jgi:DNA replication protein DnaC